MRHIDYYLTVVSPWVYLVGNRAAEIAARHGASLTYKPCDPVSLFARTGGKMLNERHESRQDYRLQELRRQSGKLDKPLNIQPAFFPTNPAPAGYALIAAQKVAATGEGGDIHKLVQDLSAACWAGERNVAEDDVIGDCLEAAGFSRGLTMSGMLTGAETYARNTEEAVVAGVFGFPFFVVDGTEKFWGQDRLDDLDLFLAGKL